MRSRLAALASLVVVSLITTAVEPTRAQGQIFCVRAGATGSGSGLDWTNAYASVPATLVRGATYYIAAGSYGAYTFDDAVSGTTPIVIKRATAASHGPATGWSSAFGDGAAQWTQVTFATSYWVFDGATGGGPGAWTTGFGFTFTSAAGASLNYVALADGVTNVTVRHASFTQTGNTEVTTAEVNAIYDSGAVSASLFEDLYIDNITGLPFFFRAGSGNILQFNYTGNICGMSVADPNQHCEALVLHDMDDVHFRWNFITESPSSGGFVKNNTQTSDSIRIYGNVIGKGFPINCNTGPCTNWRIFNNTFYQTTGGPVGGDGARTGWLIYDNLIFNGSVAALSSTHDYNWLSQLTGMSCNMTVAAHENCTARFPNNCDVCSETADPFVDSAHLNFALAAPLTAWPGTDLCVLAGCAGENKYNLDMLGRTRGGSGVDWSRGAFQYGTGPAPPTGVQVVP